MPLVEPLMTSPLLYPLLVGLCSLDGVLPVIPSEPAVLAAGVFAHAGTPNLMLVVLASALGVVIGDHLAYGLSRSVVGPRLIGRSRRLSRGVDAAGRQIDRRAGLLIVTSRFLPGGRVTMNAACGTTRLPLSRFSPASAIAALAWAAYTAGLGFLGGAAFLDNPLVGVAVGLGLSFMLGGIVELLRRRTTAARSGPCFVPQSHPRRGRDIRRTGRIGRRRRHDGDIVNITCGQLVGCGRRAPRTSLAAVRPAPSAACHTCFRLGSGTRQEVLHAQPCPRG